MENLLENFSRNANFWNLNPQFVAILEFRELYDNDKSKDKVASSNIMWALAFMTHPDSVFVNLGEEEKASLIAKDYIGDAKFDFKTVKDQKAMFQKVMLTKARRSLDAWEIKLRERDDFISITSYTMETADSLDKILKNTADLWKQYKSIRADVLRDGNTVSNKGGQTPSLSDDGLI